MQRSGVTLGSFKPTEPLHCCKKTKSQSGAGEDYIISNRMIMMKQKNALSELLQYYAILLRYLEIKEEHHGISFQKKWGLGRSRVAWPGRWKLHVEPGPLVLAETPGSNCYIEQHRIATPKSGDVDSVILGSRIMP